MTIFSRLSRNSRNGTIKIASLSVTLALSFCIVLFLSVSDVHAGGWSGINTSGPLQFTQSRGYNGTDTFPIMKTIAEKFSIESDSSGIIFKRGRANVNNYLDGGSTLLKQFIGVVFAPIFYCFQHPLILLVAFFCLSVLFIIMENFMNSNKSEKFVSINSRKFSKKKQYQNTAPHVLFIKEQERRAHDKRKPLPDKQQVRIS